MDLFDDDGPEDAGQSNAPEFTVTEISGAVKKSVEAGFGHVRVRGEVGRVSRPRSGHIYLDLKDDRSVLAGVMWKGRAEALAQQPEEGMEVIATGKLTTFPGQSKYQMVIEDIAPAGAGALMAMLEKRKAALAAEGLFEAERKQALPYLPEIIGVVTSPSGAVIRDILHRLRDRFPRKVLVWPVAVQGQKCAPEVAAAIRGFNAMTPGGALPRPDLLIVARGGGSLEDLWGFNEEIVARAVTDSQIPLISAVGHETDTTLIDYVSDLRAPTPTAAAEHAVPVRLELLGWTEEQGARLTRALSGTIERRQQRVRDLGRALPSKDALLAIPQQRLDNLADSLPRALKSATAKKRVRLADVSGALRPAALTRAIAQDRRRLTELSMRLGPALERRVSDGKRSYAQASKGLRADMLQDRITRTSVRLETTLARLGNQAGRTHAARVAQLETLKRMHETLGYKETLKRGYAVVRGDGAVVTNTQGAKAAVVVEVEFADGRVVLGGTKQG